VLGEGGAACWGRAKAGSALGLGTPSSVEAGYVQSGLEPGAKDRGPCSACFGTWPLPQPLDPASGLSLPGGFTRRELFCLLLLGWCLGTRRETGHRQGPEQKPGRLDSYLPPEFRQWHWYLPLNHFGCDLLIYSTNIYCFLAMDQAVCQALRCTEEQKTTLCFTFLVLTGPWERQACIKGKQIGGELEILLSITRKLSENCKSMKTRRL
jgi:hypothetical protein